MNDCSVLCVTAPHQTSQDMLVKELPNTAPPFLAFFATRSSVSAIFRRCTRHHNPQLYPQCIPQVDVHLMQEKTKRFRLRLSQPAQCNALRGGAT